MIVTGGKLSENPSKEKLQFIFMLNQFGENQFLAHKNLTKQIINPYNYFLRVFSII